MQGLEAIPILISCLSMVLNDHIDKLFCPLEDPRDSHVSVPVSHFHLELELARDKPLKVSSTVRPVIT